MNPTTNKQEPLGGEKDAGRVMMSAHALVPHGLSHPDKMRWIADYFLNNFTVSQQAGAAVASVTRESALAAINHLALPNWPRLKDEAMSMLTATSTKPDAGAAGASEVKPWQERLTGNDDEDVGSVFEAMKFEIADLRAQLARQQAPVGESIDTPQFRELLESFGYNWTNGDEQQRACRAALIAHIDAQLPRKRQASEKVAEDLAWYKAAHDAVSGKLKSVWQGIRDAVEEYSGKPCEGEPFDRLDELLARLSAPQAHGEPVATVEAGKFANRLQWVSDEAMAQTPVGSKLYLGPAPQADEVVSADASTVRDAARLAFLLANPTMRVWKSDISDEWYVSEGDEFAFAGGPNQRAAIDDAMALKRTTAADNQKGGAA